MQHSNLVPLITILLAVCARPVIGQEQLLANSSERTSQTFAPEGTTAKIGDGYNTLTGDLKGPCVKYGGDTSLTSYVPAQSTAGGLIRISSKSELRSVLALSVAASFGFGIFRQSASFSEYRDARFSASHQSLALYEYVTNSTRTLKGAPQLMPAAKAALKRGSKQFIVTCGDSYVAGFLYGGDFVEMFDATQNASDSYQDLGATLQVGIGAFGSGNGSLRRALAIVDSSATYTSRLVRDGSEDPTPSPNPDSLQIYWEQFPTRVRAGEHPYKMAVILASYEQVSDVPEKYYATFQQIGDGLRHLTLLRNHLEEVAAIIDTLDDAQHNPVDYVNVAQDRLAEQLADNRRDSAQLAELAKRCDDDVARCTDTLPALASTGLSRKSWKVLDPKLFYYLSSVAVFSTGPTEAGVRLELRGLFCRHLQTLCQDVSAGQDEVAFVDRSTGKMSVQTYGNIPLQVPANSEVRIYLMDGVVDGSYVLGAADNEPFLANPIRVALYQSEP